MSQHRQRLRRKVGRFRTAISASFTRAEQDQENRCRLYVFGSIASSTRAFDTATPDAIDGDVFVDIMGKSNKFDYTNRNSSGPKLGHIIGRDLDKEADKVQQDADKQAKKARKQSADSITSIDSMDMNAVIHVLDIKVPEKQLTDEGACAMAAGLEAALRKASNEASVLLEDLNLSGNGLTAASLARLAPIISLAKHDLKTLNLSKNAIKVESDDEAAQWETFLRAFSCCRKLRRLDLSGNRHLGARAMEILARCHIEEHPVDTIAVAGDASVYSLNDETDADEQQTPRADVSCHALANARHLRRRCGLRSIPYLTLTDVGLTDAGALWLSYVIEDHHLPNQLIDELNAANADSTIKTYQQGMDDTGIAWDKREASLGKDGASVLERAETIRQQAMVSDQTGDEHGSMMDSTSADNELRETDSISSRSIIHRNVRAAHGARRSSVRSIRTEDGGEHELSVLESARKKIQRAIIEQQGMESVELWRAGVRVRVAWKYLLGLGLHRWDSNKYYTGPPLFEFSQLVHVADRRRDSRPTTPRTPAYATPVTHRVSDSGHGSPWGGMRQGTYAATLTANISVTAGEPELAITEVTNTPTTPKTIFKPHRKGAFSEGQDLKDVTKKLEALVVRDADPKRFVRWQQDRIANFEEGQDAFRNSRVPSLFPVDVMERIVSELIPAREMAVLSEKQIRSARDWVWNAANVETEKSWKKFSGSMEKWLLLESIGCLEYHRDR